MTRIVALLGVLALSPALQSIHEPTSLLEARLGRILNEYRLKQGLEPVEENRVLSGFALRMAIDQSQQPFLSHRDAKGRSLAQRAKEDLRMKFIELRENLGAGQTSAEEIMEGWMKSRPHRANIDSGNITHYGISLVVRSDRKERPVWVLMLAELPR